MRTLILGGPAVGKTTLANEMGKDTQRAVRHADDLMKDHKWSEASDVVASWINEPDAVIEGTAVVRGLRKWLAANPGIPLPDTEIVVMTQPLARRSDGQEAMAKGVETIWDGVAKDVQARGATVRRVIV